MWERYPIRQGEKRTANVQKGLMGAHGWSHNTRRERWYGKKQRNNKSLRSNCNCAYICSLYRDYRLSLNQKDTLGHRYLIDLIYLLIRERPAWAALWPLTKFKHFSCDLVNEQSTSGTNTPQTAATVAGVVIDLTAPKILNNRGCIYMLRYYTELSPSGHNWRN